ncbi:MAG: hypothetical protein ABIE74_13035 [Pseudomonadota bacterium]
MKKIVEHIEIIDKFKDDMCGVFTLGDLKSIFPSKDFKTFYRRIADLEKLKILKRFTRGIYVTKDFDPNVLSQKLCERSYISFETILAKHLMIGTIPKNQIRAVKIGKKREYKFQNLTIVHIGVSEHLYFGYETINGVNFATKEKALLDTLYFYNKGLVFYFDIYSDIDLRSIDRNIIEEYLKKYKNPKFISFVNKYFEDNKL